MHWLSLSLLSAAIFAAVTVSDKQMFGRVYRSANGLNFLVAVVNIVTGAVFLAIILPFNGMPSDYAVLVAVGSGVFWALGLTLFFYGLQVTEASRAVPIWMSAPIFAAILAGIFLGERITVLQWVAIIVVVVGAALASYKPLPGRNEFISVKSLAVLLLAAALTGAAFVVNKEATDSTGVWEVQGFRNLVMGAIMAVLAWRPGLVRELARSMRKPSHSGQFIATEGIAAPFAAFLLILAIESGPVSLVSAVSSARPIFLLLLTTLLSTRYWNLLNEPLDRGTLAVKGVSVVAITAGVGALAVL